MPVWPSRTSGGSQRRIEAEILINDNNGQGSESAGWHLLYHLERAVRNKELLFKRNRLILLPLTADMESPQVNESLAKARTY